MTNAATRLTAVVLCTAIFGVCNLDNARASVSARSRAQTERAVGGGWSAGVAERLDALRSQSTAAARSRRSARDIEPEQRALVATKPYWAEQAGRALEVGERRRR